MAKFIKLTGKDGMQIRINTDYIVEYSANPGEEGGSILSCNLIYEIRPNDENGTDYYYQEIQVAETPDYLDEKLNETNMEQKLSESSKPKQKKTKFQVKWDGKTVGSANAIVAMGDTLALFADACGVDKVIRACSDSGNTNPTVMTDEKANEITKDNKNLEARPLPRYSGYSYLALRLTNRDKRNRLNELAEQLGISDRVKVEP